MINTLVSNSRILIFLPLGICFLVSPLLFAKVGDPLPLVEGNTIYRSHSNYVEAVNAQSEENLWKTILYDSIEPEKYNNREHDVQWNIITSLQFVDVSIKATNTHGDIFFLDKTTGNLIEKIEAENDNNSLLFENIESENAKNSLLWYIAGLLCCLILIFLLLRKRLKHDD